MAYSKRSDAANARKGGVGVDGNRDIDWVYDQTDFEAQKAMYGRSWPNRDGCYGLDTCDARYVDDGASGSALLDGAREGWAPQMGPGNPQSSEQTGIRKPAKRRSGAY